MNTSKLTITDHAVLRYLERVGGFDIARLRASMAAKITTAHVPGAAYVNIDGVSFAVRDNDGQSVVTTALTGTKARKPRRKRKGARK